MASKRSSTPPCPGRMVPKSLSPRSRLSIDSTQVAEGGEDRHHDAEQQTVGQRVPRVQADDGDDDAHHHRRGHAAGQALERLVGRDVGHERSVAEPRADEVAGDVVAHRAQHEADDHADAVGEHEEQAREPAEDADVANPKMVTAALTIGRACTTLARYQNNVKTTTTADDQRERPFSVVVGDAHHGGRPEEREERGGLEPGPTEALEQLERGGGDDHGDEHRGAGAADRRTRAARPRRAPRR